MSLPAFSLRNPNIPVNIFFAFENKIGNCSAMNFAPKTMSAQTSSLLANVDVHSVRYRRTSEIKDHVAQYATNLYFCPLTLCIPGSRKSDETSGHLSFSRAHFSETRRGTSHWESRLQRARFEEPFRERISMSRPREYTFCEGCDSCDPEIEVGRVSMVLVSRFCSSLIFRLTCIHFPSSLGINMLVLASGM
jgi:hypothetical protein